MPVHRHVLNRQVASGSEMSQTHAYLDEEIHYCSNQNMNAMDAGNAKEQRCISIGLWGKLTARICENL